MKFPVLLVLAAALAATAVSAFAEPRIPVARDPDRAHRVTAAQMQRQLLLRQSESVLPKAGTAVNSATPSLPTPNPYDAYPPSCMAHPLPDQVSGPVYSTVVNLGAYNSAVGDVDQVEGVTITIWRVACSSDAFFNSATLMRIQRQAQYEGDTQIYPVFPIIDIKQSSANYDQIARFALEPNTVLSDVLPETPIVFSTTYVLENYIGINADYFDFNTPFSVRFDNLFSTNNLYFINNIPLYDPNTTTYPAAFQNIPISGYLGTSWYDPATSGEGIVMQVYQRLGELNTFVLSFTWSAYDPDGFPFWLTGQVDIIRGAKVANSPMFYVTGGGLGGNAGTANPPTPWGTATVTFPDCNHMTLTYASNPGLPSFVPQGSGTRNWTRLGRLNGLPCE